MNFNRLYFLFFLSILSLTISGQEYIVLPNNQTLEVNIIYQIQGKDSIKIAKYLNDSIAYRYKIYKGKISGVYQCYYPNGQLYIRGIYMNGLRHGEWKNFDNKGVLTLTGQYLYDKKAGSWYDFQNGRVEMYREGEARGRWRIDEGWTPRTLFRYRKGILVKVKRHPYNADAL
ncbi:MAG: hypothetical protein JXR60_11000 [Bacteroidales bacterium]|nr:hypothetical protein [Bacteroidales bacterium]